MADHPPYWRQWQADEPPFDVEKLADGWIQEAQFLQSHPAYRNSDADWEWVTPDEALNALLHNDPDRAWAVLIAIVARAPLEMLPKLGAGPLEELFHQTRTRFLEAVEERAASDGRFRACLSGALGCGLIPDDMRARLLKAMRSRESDPK